MIISRTPLRISLAGGGSDLEEYYRTGCGAVVSTAIDKYIYITVNEKFDDMIRISYSQTEIVDHVDQIKHNVIREALRLAGIEKKIEVVYMGDIPLGTAGVGLGSSSGLAVGALNAFYAFNGLHASAERLAADACRVEIDILKHPMGKQDQYISAYGGFNYIQFHRDGAVSVDPIVCHPDTKRLLHRKFMLFYTGIVRLSSSILAEQKTKTSTNLAHLDQMVSQARHVRDQLVDNKINEIGDILHEGWLLKKKLADGISNPQIDHYYAKARAAGAAGGKILGAGAGGFLLLFCDEQYQNKVRAALHELQESPFQFELQGSKIIYVHD